MLQEKSEPTGVLMSFVGHRCKWLQVDLASMVALPLGRTGNVADTAHLKKADGGGHGLHGHLAAVQGAGLVREEETEAGMTITLLSFRPTDCFSHRKT